MLRILLLVGIGGFIGSVFRHLIYQFVDKSFTETMPYGIFIVNAVGCLLIGLAFGFLQKNSISQDWYIFLATGFCGGFTTFSAFSLDNLRLIQNGEFLIAFVYAFGSVLVGLVAVYLGLMISKLI